LLESYADRWALITGASSGIGAAFARRLAAHGMHLVLVARRREPMEELAADLHTRHGTRCEILPHDLAEHAEVERLVAEIAGRGIEIELLVNSAGVALIDEIERTDVERVLWMLRINVSAMTELTYRFLPAMLARGRGAVINVSSTAAFQPVAWMGPYAASKAYVLHFSESLWVEVRDRGVTVLALCPGVTRTNFFEAAGVENWLKKRSSHSPDYVVRKALRALEKRRLYAVPGWGNYLRSLVVRFGPRKLVVKQTMDYFRPPSSLTKKPDDADKPRRSDVDRGAG
jgi:short-subunit dehydrogenase